MSRMGLESRVPYRDATSAINRRQAAPVQYWVAKPVPKRRSPASGPWEIPYQSRSKSLLASAIAHGIAILGIIVISLAPHPVKPQPKPPEHVTLVAPPPESYALQVARVQSGGGGGGGDRDIIEAPKGRLPKVAKQQITPPQIIVRNEHPKLTAEPTVVAPQVQMSATKLPNLGDPAAPAMPTVVASNGTGSGAGIGSGSGGGIGKGAGPGVGEGHGGGIGGGAYRVGGAVLAPRPIEMPDPAYTEQARAAKLQGVCVLALIVDANGTTRDIRVVRSLGMGLDEKAIDAVRRWTFKPATKDGAAVPVQISVQVSFKLY